MLSEDFLQSLNLQPESAEALKAALRKEDFYRGVLYKAGIYPTVINSIMRTVDPATLDESKEALYIEKARVEWKDFIPARGADQINTNKKAR